MRWSSIGATSGRGAYSTSRSIEEHQVIHYEREVL
jgi:hypothetical protein